MRGRAGSTRRAAAARRRGLCSHYPPPCAPGSDRLLVRGKYQPKYIESLLRKYIQEFVICAMCR